MSARMKTHRINPANDTIQMHHQGVWYEFPREIAELYRIDEPAVSAEEVFAELHKKYTKPGALLKGIRLRENLTQVEIAEKLNVTQSDISQMESGNRTIGRTIAKRIESLFDVDYRSFLE